MNTDDINKLKEVGQINVGGPVADSEAKLCLYAEDIDIDYISSMLGIKPTEGIRKGEVIGRRRPVPIGHWFLKAPDELSFEDKLKYLLNKTTANHSIWSSLALNHDIQLRCAIYLRTWTEGFDLPAAVVAEIGNRHWQFGLTMYSAEGEELVDGFLSETVRKKENTKAQQKNRGDGE